MYYSDITDNFLRSWSARSFKNFNFNSALNIYIYILPTLSGLRRGRVLKLNYYFSIIDDVLLYSIIPMMFIIVTGNIELY